MPIRPGRRRDPARRARRTPRTRPRTSAQQPKRHPERAQRLAASASLTCRISARRRRSAARLLAHQLVRTARQQHVGGALGQARAAVSCCSASLWIVLISLRSEENGTSPRAGSARRAPRPPARPCARRRSAPLRSGRPAPSSARRAPPARRCWRGRRRPARARARLGARAVDGAASVAPELALGRVAGAFEAHAPLAVTTTRTVISFLVSVPVLSEAMTSPSRASRPPPDAGRWRCRFAMRCTPIESTAGHHRRQPFGHRRDRERHAEDQHVEERGEAAHILDQEDRRDHHHRDDHDDDRRAACRRDRAPSAAASSRPALPSAARRCAPSRSASRSP